ncbi:MAG TPA: cyanophycin synthetase [Gaiellaceae bacterium]|nr:cyanophycin synthetase [Gaiellaceae bacterium]
MRPLEGRRIWLVGLGGAGLSAYGLLAHAWGAEVGGWDRNETPYLAAVRAAGLEVRVSPEPEVPAGWEVFVSSAYPTVAGRARGELLAELVLLRDSIVVAGAHGKTTTAAMIAFALRETGGDPSWIVGGEVPQLGANAGAGGGWLVVEGDESDRSVAALRPRIAVVTNLGLDHHSEFASEAEVAALFDGWLAQVPEVVRGWELAPVELDLLVPGEHNRRNAAAALAALELAGVGRGEAATALARFTGVGRRFELVGEVGGVSVYDDYAHNPAKVAAAIATARARTEGRVLVLFQPHLYSRTRHVAAGLGRELAAADVVAVADVYPAREEPVEGVSGKLVVDALVDARPGFVPGWTPDLEDAVRFLARRARAGDLVLTIGAGDVDRAARQLVVELGR